MSKKVLFTKTHEWVDFVEKDLVRIGLTDYAQHELGDLVFVNLPEEGDELEAGEVFADVESVKAVSNVFSPVTGVVSSVNEDLLDQPELINQAPYEAWLIEVKEITYKEELLTKDEYEKLIG